MAEGRAGDKLFWLDPIKRGILPLDGFHLSRRLLRTVLSGVYAVTVDRNFAGTIAGCATPVPDRTDTWINPQIERLFTDLFRMGHAHSVETWQGDTLVGGLYGVALGGAFFGESMFSFARDASKVALVHLVARLRLGGFTLLDTQFVTGHLAQFGAEEIPRDLYKQLSGRRGRSAGGVADRSGSGNAGSRISRHAGPISRRRRVPMVRCRQKICSR